MTEHFTPELGQYAFTNTPWHSVSTPHYITAGFDIIAAAIQEARGIDPEREYPLTSNSGADPWEGEVFQMRCYCWCDGERADHKDGCPPNFHYAPTGFQATWYKHASRGESCSSPVPSPVEWGQIVAACVGEVSS